MNIQTYAEAKSVLCAALAKQGRSRADLGRSMDAQGLMRAHTVACLLSSAPVIGRRQPSFDSLVALASAVNFDVALVPRSTRKRPLTCVQVPATDADYDVASNGVMCH